MRKTIYIIILLISIFIILIYFVSQSEAEAARVAVEITKNEPFNALNESERNELIGDVSLKKIYLKKLAAPKGSGMYMPGISVALFSNRIMVSEWTSVPIQDRGIYELTVGLNQPLIKGDVVRIAVYVNDDKGNVIIGKRRDVIWN